MSSRWLDRVGLENAEEFWTVIDRYSCVRAVVWGLSGDSNWATRLAARVGQGVAIGLFALGVWLFLAEGIGGRAGLLPPGGLDRVRAVEDFPDEETMIRWIEQPSLVPFLVCVAPGTKESFRGFVVRRMIEETRQEDGRCFETFRRINVSATK